MNKVILIWNITQDLELRQTPNGKSVLSLSIATNKKVKTEGGYEDKAEFHNLVAWNKTAEVIAEYQAKGNKIAVEGELQTRSWEGDDGVKRYRTEVLINTVEFLSSGGWDVKPQAKTTRKSKAAPKKATPKSRAKEELDVSDLPF